MMPSGLAKFIATFGYVGYTPKLPGTAGSFVVAALVYCFMPTTPVLFFLIVFSTVLGLASAGQMESIEKKKDPGCVVIDEVAGMLIGFLFVPINMTTVIIAFFVFRFFDITKIYPVNKLEKIPGATGIMVDDLVAGVYTCIIMQLIVMLLGLR